MIHWIETHGIECMLIWWFLAAIVDTFPPVSDSASIWLKWFGGFMHALSANLKMAKKLLKLPEVE